MGPFAISVRSPMEDIAWNFEYLYTDYPLAAAERMADFCVYAGYPRGLRRWYKPQVIFEVDGTLPYKPYPAYAAIAMLEWGLNWTLFSSANQYLLFHAACLEKRGHCILLAGEPGSGKSTLCAAMALQPQPWRLFTDEITIVRPNTPEILPLCRPICLKNQSIDIIERRYPDAIVGHRCPNTAKGTVAHVKVPHDSIVRMNESAPVNMILFPKYQKEAKTSWCELPKPEILLQLARQSFNYSTLGETAFQTLKKMGAQSNAYEVVYSDLDEVLAQLDELFGDLTSHLETSDTQERENRESREAADLAPSDVSPSDVSPSDVSPSDAASLDFPTPGSQSSTLLAASNALTETIS